MYVYPFSDTPWFVVCYGFDNPWHQSINPMLVSYAILSLNSLGKKLLISVKPMAEKYILFSESPRAIAVQSIRERYRIFRDGMFELCFCLLNSVGFFLTI